MAARKPRAKSRRRIDQVRTRQIVQETVRRSDNTEVLRIEAVAQSLLDGLTPPQRAFVSDPATQKAALCTRRAGKTWACKIALLHIAITQPDSVSVYINSSRNECINIVLQGQHGLIALAKEHNLKFKVNRTRLTMTFLNGSEIRLIGVDDAGAMEKLRGDAYDLVVIDESAKFGELQYFCTDVIFPSLGDRQGTLCLIGTPSSSCAGYFHDVTKDLQDRKNQGWSVHRWNYKDNSFLPHLEDFNQGIKKANGWGDDHPSWLREYCGKWIKTAELLVYSFNEIPEEERYHDGLPEGVDNAGKAFQLDWEYILGADLGYSDAFAYSVWAYSPNHPVAYEMASFKEARLNNNQQAEIIVDLMKEYDFSRIVIDGSPATIEAWKEQYSIPGERAEKQHKHSYIAQWNAAMITGKVKFERGSALSIEMASLQWKEKTINSPRPAEDKKNTPNDVCDSSLYAWKELINWAWEPMKGEILQGTEAYYKRMEELDEEAACLTAMGGEASNYYELFSEPLN